MRVVIDTAILQTRIVLFTNLHRLSSSTFDEEKTQNGLFAGGALGVEGKWMVDHDTNAEEYQVSMPQ